MLFSLYLLTLSSLSFRSLKPPSFSNSPILSFKIFFSSLIYSLHLLPHSRTSSLSLLSLYLRCAAVETFLWWISFWFIGRVGCGLLVGSGVIQRLWWRGGRGLWVVGFVGYWFWWVMQWWVLVYGVVDCGGELIWCGGKLQLWYHNGVFFI